MSRVLVIGRKAGGMCRFGDLAGCDLVECVDALAFGGEGEHEMHVCGGGVC